jgi:hypothetical protein
MKIITFLDKEEDLEALARFLSDERIVVERIYPLVRGQDATFYVFYENAEEQVKREKEELNKLDRIAIELEKDRDYEKLKNATQRELYLLSKFDLPNAHAKRVIELLNMRKILAGEGGKSE